MKKQHMIMALVLIATLAIVIRPVFSASGATIISNTTETGPTISPEGLTNARATINTVILDSLQQDQHWKAYVGNISGTLTLDDALNNTIYDWSDLGAPSGEVYASRSNNFDFTTASCADSATITTEMTFNNMTGTDADAINNTFNYSIHAEFHVGSRQVPQNNCSSTALYVSDAEVNPTTTSDFQEILMEDSSNRFVYVALINDDTTGFDDNSYDFQMIVAESDVKASPTTYYFYLEID